MTPQEQLDKRGIDQTILKNIVSEILTSTEKTVFGYNYLCKTHSIKNAREVRKYIAAARTIFKAPIANVKGGYKRADNWDDYKRTFYAQIKHAVSIIKTQNAVRKEFAIRNNLSLFDQSIFDTEFEDIIRIVDAWKEKK
jgi:hypothetical protein